MLETPPTRPEENRRRPLHSRITGWTRTLHTYLSLFSLTLILFFSVTGITLNHPEWFPEGVPVQQERTGMLPSGLLTPGGKVARLEIAERLRAAEKLRGTVEEFRVEDSDCMISFRSPGYAADIFLDRRTGTYQLSIMEEGRLAFLNDLHRGAGSGAAWSGAIDACAVFLITIALSGLVLTIYLRHIRFAGLMTAVTGLVALALLIRFFVS